ncbi:hypothetical protein [Companilactobacillus farciminis]|uniref:hypothetical protein n=1 Tax=Companilactobacillus farciminis TaxID=1612 RepID=UPI00232E92EA|nr:hypothetical protein [Companilactobacillus farciminis]WCG35433.1 hypothetical protein PML84_11510 [Companilactobacillus farciminis]
MIISSFNSQDGSWGIMNYQEIFTNRYYLNAIGHSFTLSLSASLFSEVIAILGAWALTKMSSTVKESLVTIFNLASSFAGVPLAFSLIILLGNSGVVHVISKSMNINFLSSINRFCCKVLNLLSNKVE